MKFPLLESPYDVSTLSRFMRDSATLVKQAIDSDGPVVIKDRGKAKFVILGIEGFSELFNLASKYEMLEFLKRSKADADAGRTVNARDYFKQLTMKTQPSTTSANGKRVSQSKR